MKKSNEQKELEMSVNWLDIYSEKLRDVPGDSINEKIDTLLFIYNKINDMADGINDALRELIELHQIPGESISQKIDYLLAHQPMRIVVNPIPEKGAYSTYTPKLFPKVYLDEVLE